MNTDELTPRQRRAYDVIRKAIEQTGQAPEVREVGEALGFAHPNNAAVVVRELVELGCLEEVTGPGGKRVARGLRLPGRPAGFSLDILGDVAAGVPIPAGDDADNPERFDFAAAFGGGDTFMLRVKGTSMIEDLIGSGDLVVVRRSPEAGHGEEVVVEIGGEHTLKVYVERNGERWLYPRNAQARPIRLEPGAEPRVIGVLVGVVRPVRPRRAPPVAGAPRRPRGR